jgi:isoleucyl-tRNA synthetase
VQQGDEYYILGRETLKMLRSEPEYKIIKEMKGADLVGMSFVPHYDYYPIADGEKAWEIVGGDFVTEDEGTGIVTLAAYGEEDMVVMREQNIHIETHVDDEGMIKSDVPLFGGMYYLKANKAVNADLTERGLVYDDQPYTHTVAHCWRCATQLFYNPQNAWYVNIAKLKPLMEKTNEQINWFPGHFKHGRFLKSMQNAPDWNISRNRYWGSPIPVWECENGHFYVPESITELEAASGRAVHDLHKPEIDEVVVTCPECQKPSHRVPEVLDSWIEAGSASFAERHFPFNTEFKLEDFFPPDFIAEYTGQIRAWFYVLHVIGAALYEAPAFKNVQVTGVIMGTDGRKMSKNFKNYPDPKTMLSTYGGDALRLYLLSTPVMKGEDIRISEEEYRNQVRGLMLVLWNVYKFYVTYANVSGYTPTKQSISTNILDQWIVSRKNVLVQDVTQALDAYDTVSAIMHIQHFVDDLSTWWLRRSRDRMSAANENADDREMAFFTMQSVLQTVCLLSAPLAPFITEEMYRSLTGEDSVHLASWPTAKQEAINSHLEGEMQVIRKLAEVGNATRKEVGVAVKQPLSTFTITQPQGGVTVSDDGLLQMLREELNVKEIVFATGEESVHFDTKLTPKLVAEGQARDLIRKIQGERKKMGTAMDELVDVTVGEIPEGYEDEIRKKASIRHLTVNDGPLTVLRLTS